MSFFKPQARITMGLVGIMTSLIMLAFFLNIVPDRGRAVMEGRAALAESIAIYSTALVKTATVVVANNQRLEKDFNLLAERNEDLLSLALRHDGGHLLVSTGDHDTHWVPMEGKYSKGAQVRVPIWAGKQVWGQLELRFNPLPGEVGWNVLKNPMVQLVLFMCLLGFAVYYFYLGKVLRQLDPSQAIPGRVRSALDTMAEGLLILDRKEQIVLANQAFSDMIDKPAEELLGFRAGELPWLSTTGSKIEKEKRPWVRALAQGKVKKDSTVRLLLADNSSRTFKTNSSPVLGEGGKYAGVLVSFDDITELEEKEVQLRHSKLEAEEANRAKSFFLANMSHEIRTPMNAILGFADILKRGYVKNEEESLKYLNIIHSSGKNLLEIINDILDLSKVESGHLEIEKLKIKPYVLIHEVLQVLKVNSDEKGLVLEFNAIGDLPAEIETDPVRMRQILLNLVGNAIKFTEKGVVSVTCRYEAEGSSPRYVIDVADSGIGMTEETQKTIFDPFVQADNTVSRRFGGTGLGLAISHKLAREMGGDIVVKSKPGEGSTFTFSLAAGDLAGVAFLSPAALDGIKQEIHVEESSRWQFDKASVLVVDDGAENRELVKFLLEGSGLTVNEAENGQVAVEMATKTTYSMILMDVQMPVMDGFTAAGILRKQGIKVPIVALTANAMHGFDEQCLAAGYSDYLSKPINIDDLMDLTAKLLGGHKVESPAPALDVSSQAHSSGADLPIVSTLPSDNEKLRGIVVRFVTRLDEQLTAMEEALVNDDFKKVLSLAHWLKGAAGTVGFNGFTSPAESLEKHAMNEDKLQTHETVTQLRSLYNRIVVPSD
jgi:signal transduction histidine kinase/DNA-binding NarL/FixJ family response regulator